jgi:hypothetical protein
MQNLHFNTTSLQGEALVVANQKAFKCADYILSVFKEYPHSQFTPFQVRSNIIRIYGKKYPITSVRAVRARMTTLTEKKKDLIKSDKAAAKGEYGKPNHVWKLNSGTE